MIFYSFLRNGLISASRCVYKKVAFFSHGRFLAFTVYLDDRKKTITTYGHKILGIKTYTNILLTMRKQRMVAQAISALKTKNMQAIIQEVMAVIPSVLGEILVMELKMLVSTRKSVTRSAIRPGTTSGGMRKLTHDTTTKSPLGKQQIYKYLEIR